MEPADCILVGGERATGTGAKLVEAETMESMVLRVRSEGRVSLLCGSLSLDFAESLGQGLESLKCLALDFASFHAFSGRTRKRWHNERTNERIMGK